MVMLFARRHKAGSGLSWNVTILLERRFCFLCFCDLHRPQCVVWFLHLFVQADVEFQGSSNPSASASWVVGGHCVVVTAWLWRVYCWLVDLEFWCLSLCRGLCVFITDISGLILLGGWPCSSWDTSTTHPSVMTSKYVIRYDTCSERRSCSWLRTAS